MNEKISVFVFCVEPIICLLLYNLHDCIFKSYNFLFADPWSLLISAYLDSSDFHSSSHPFSTFRSSCKLILCLLVSSLFLTHLLSSTHITSPELASAALVSSSQPHLTSSQRTLKSSQLFSGPKPIPKTNLGAKAGNPYAFHRKH